MIVSDFITDAYRTYRGKTSNVPQVGDTKYTDILAIGNRKLREWANDANNDWASTYQQYAAGTLVSGTQQYALGNTNIMKPSDYLILTSPDGTQKKYVKMLHPFVISRYTDGAYLSGANNQQLIFLTTIGTSLNGWTITLPCFVMPTAMVNPTDTVPVDDPNWLVYATAAELARNDYAKEEQYQNIKSQADSLYSNMVADSQNNGYLQPNGAVNNMPQFVSGFESGYNGSTSTAPWGYN